MNTISSYRTQNWQKGTLKGNVREWESKGNDKLQVTNANKTTNLLQAAPALIGVKYDSRIS